MNMKKITSKFIIMLLLFSHIGIKTYANLPYITNVQTESLDKGVKLSISGTSGSITSYMIKRADTRAGNYKVIVDNLTERYYEDKGLENGKTYYYKIFARNNEGLGKESDIYEGIPSKSHYLWLEVYGKGSRICGLDVFDADGNKILYSSHYYDDDTARDPYRDDFAYYLIKHYTLPVNHDRWNYSSTPMTRIGLKLEPNKGIEKISIFSREYAPIKADIYETAGDRYYDNKYNEMSVVFKVSDDKKEIEYELYKSGLKAEGDDRQVTLKWNSIKDVKNYTIKRAEDKAGPFINIVNEISNNEYVDQNVENNKTYYYKVQAITDEDNLINLGNVHTKTTKDRYITLDFFESYDQDDIWINELEILDRDNKKIDYIVDNFADFDTKTSINNISCLGGAFRHFNNAKDGNLDNEDYNHFVILYNDLNGGEWARYTLKLDENTGVERINFWAGTSKQPKKVTFYKSLSYDYKDNLVLRRNDNLSFFAEKNIADNDVVTKYEFTQTAPNTPQGVNANSQDTKATIKWNKVDNADSYTIKRSTSSGGPYTVLQENIVDLQYTDMGLANGTEYYYVVSAVNKGGESNNSLEASVIPSAKLPQAPIGLTIEAQQNVLNLSWNPVYNATSYTIKRSETAGGPYEKILEDTTATSYNDSGLTFGTTYYYVVSAKNTIGTSNNSEEVQGTPGQVLPEKPTNLITKVKENKVYLTWDTASHAVRYNVFRSESEEGIYNILDNVKGLSYKDATVEADKTYFYKIIAKNEEGESEESEKVRVIVKDNIEQKILLSLTMKNGSTKEYIITHSQLMKFMNWYQCNTMKQGLPYFTLMANNKYGAYKSSKKYILFDSIMAMDVKEVQAN